VIISIAPIRKSLARTPRFVADAGVPEVTWRVRTSYHSYHLSYLSPARLPGLQSNGLFSLIPPDELKRGQTWLFEPQAGLYKR